MDAIWGYLLENVEAKILAVFVLLILLDVRKQFKSSTDLFNASLKEMSESIKNLTTQMAVIVERVDSHEKRIDRLEG